MIRYSLINGKQTLEEVCEHCGEKVKDIHISEITTLNPKDPRKIQILGKDNKTYQDVPLKEKLVSDLTASYIREGLLDDAEAKEFEKKKELKYGVRPEAMCSQSIDSVAGVTASFCYKSDNTNFLSKYSSSFHASSEKVSTDLGRKVGVDRKGNIIRMKSEKNLDEADSRLVYHGQFKTSWFRDLSTKLQKSYLEKVQECDNAIETYGKEECYSGEVMSNFKTLDAFKKWMEKNCK